MIWKLVYLYFDGSVYQDGTSEMEADSHRAMARQEQSGWDTVVNLPSLVIIEWSGSPDPSYIQWWIYARVGP